MRPEKRETRQSSSRTVDEDSPPDTPPGEKLSIADLTLLRATDAGHRWRQTVKTSFRGELSECPVKYLEHVKALLISENDDTREAFDGEQLQGLARTWYQAFRDLDDSWEDFKSRCKCR